MKMRSMRRIRIWSGSRTLVLSLAMLACSVESLAQAPATSKEAREQSLEQPIPWTMLEQRKVAELVRRVHVTQLAADTASDLGNSRVRFELSTPKILEPLTSQLQANPKQTLADQSHPVQQWIDFPQLARDWNKYRKDAGAGGIMVQFTGRSSVVASVDKTDFTTVKGDFPSGVEVTLEPGYEGTALDRVQQDWAKTVSHSLMITDVKVVNDDRARCMGPWSFGQLMKQLANETQTGIAAADFSRQWLAHWETDQMINGFRAAARPRIRQLLIDPWQELSGAGKPLDLGKAPFRLLAIVSRLDLRNNQVLGVDRIGGGGAGEARFVFCAVDLKTLDADGFPVPLPFTVIFEYEIKKSNFGEVRDWARQWHALRDHELGSATYNQALQNLTDQFSTTGSGGDPESTPNRSFLAQLRTNEIALTAPWEIREFRLGTGNDGQLHQTTVKQTPDAQFNRGFVLGLFLNQHKDAISQQRHSVPVKFLEGSFVGSAAPTEVNAFWFDSLEMRTDIRHLFSLGTCSGCHGAEAFPKITDPAFDGLDLDDPAKRPDHFTHVRPRREKHPALLSEFLAGDATGDDLWLPDPAGQGSYRPFGDLRRRAADLHDLVNYGWFYELHRLPLQFVH